MLHKGSVNGLKVVEQSGLLLSCSADGTVSVLSIPDFKQVLSISAKDMVFAVEEVGETIVVGTAKGNVLGFDLFTG
jgi:WD40 repeat protein